MTILTSRVCGSSAGRVHGFPPRVRVPPTSLITCIRLRHAWPDLSWGAAQHRGHSTEGVVAVARLPPALGTSVLAARQRALPDGGAAFDQKGAPEPSHLWIHGMHGIRWKSTRGRGGNGAGHGAGNGAGNGAGRGTRRGTVPVHRPARWPHRRGRPRVPAPEAATTRAVVVRAGEVPRPPSSRGASICCVDGPRPRRGALWWIRDGVVYHLAFVRLARFYRLSMCHVTYDNTWWVSCKSPSTPPSLPFVSPRDCIL